MKQSYFYDFYVDLVSNTIYYNRYPGTTFERILHNFHLYDLRNPKPPPYKNVYKDVCVCEYVCTKFYAHKSKLCINRPQTRELHSER